MAGVQNNTVRQIGIQISGSSGSNTVFLDPGFNFVADDVWEVASKQSQVVPLLDAGVLVAGVQQSRADVLMKEKVAREMAEVHEHEVKRNAATLIPGEEAQLEPDYKTKVVLPPKTKSKAKPKKSQDELLG